MRSSKIVFATLLILGMLGSLVFAKELDVATKRLDKTFGLAQASGPALSTLNINNLQVWVRRDGAMPPQGANGASADYPKGTTNFIYAEGMVWGVKVDDGRDPRLRVGGSTYATGHKAGKVLGDRQGDGDYSSEDPTTKHIWRVRTDWNTATLTSDAAGFHQVATADVTEAEVDEVYDQYEYDWLNWPAEDGAPFMDVDGDGEYTPAVWNATDNVWEGDIPGFPGAAQTLWTAVNDFPFADGSGEIAPNAYGSIGIGFEEQLTVWGYAFPASNPLGNIQFKRARIIYYGRSAGAVIDTAYFSQWSDPDLGTYTDDYVGFDTVLSLGYVYNGNTLDATYNGSFGLPVPAGGYDFLQGPIVDGVPLGMTSNGYFGAGSSISDPDLEEYSGTLQWFNLMEGFLPRPEYPTQTPWRDNAGIETIFPLAGDPVTGTGDIDGLVLPPGDRRMLMTTGPFTMAVGDTQDVVIALIGAMGANNLSSVSVLKYFDIFAQFAYDQGFVLPSPPASPVVEAVSGDGAITLYWGNDLDAVASTEVPVNSGFGFEGYKVYQLPNADATAAEGEVIAVFDNINNGVTTITEKTIDNATGLVLDLPAHVGNDLGVQRYVRIENDAIRSRPMTNDRPYYFGVSAYSYLPDNANSPFKSLESTMTRITAYPQPLQYEVYNAEFMGELEIAHTAGSAGGAIGGTVVDPSALTGHDYTVWFDQQHYYRDLDGVWKKTAFPDAVGKRVGPSFDVTPSTLTGAAIASADIGTIDLTIVLNYASNDGAWIDGLMMDFPDDMVFNNWTFDQANYGNYPEYDQNIVNTEGTLDPASNSITWGDDARSGIGAFEGNNVFTINIEPYDFPFEVDYVIYDDGYDVLLDATGTVTFTELGYQFHTVNQWNLMDASTGRNVLTGQTIYNGVEFSPSAVRFRIL
jgi:hypothetical protein